MSDVETALDVALGKVQEVSPEDLEKVADVAHAEAAGAFRALLERVKSTASQNQHSVLLGGLSDLFKAAASDGPSVVRHLAAELRSVAVESFVVEGSAS